MLSLGQAAVACGLPLELLNQVVLEVADHQLSHQSTPMSASNDRPPVRLCHSPAFQLRMRPGPAGLQRRR